MNTLRHLFHFFIRFLAVWFVDTISLLVTAWIISGSAQILGVGAASLVFLVLLGGIAARAGGAPILKGALRVTFWGLLAMLLTAAVGRLFGVIA